jgi:cytochrome c2
MQGTLLRIGYATVLLLVVGTRAWGANANVERGKELVDSKCMACHGTDVYTRPEHRIKSLEALENQIPRCAKAAGADWNQQQMADVVAYLNQAYYKFK